MSFLSQLRNSYKITYFANTCKNAFGYWEFFQKRCYEFKPLDASKFHKNRQTTTGIKRALDKYKNGITMKRRYDRPPSNIASAKKSSDSDRGDEPFQEPHPGSSTKQNKDCRYTVDTNVYPEIDLHDETAQFNPKKPTIWTAFKEKSKFPIWIYKKRSHWDIKPSNMEGQNPVLTSMVTRYKHDDKGAGGGEGSKKFDPENPIHSETITRSTMKGPSGLNYWVRKKKTTKGKDGKEKKPKPTSYVALTTKIFGKENRMNIYDIPLKLANDLKKIHVTGMKLNFEMDMNIKEALMNQTKLAVYEQKKLDDPKVEVSTKVAVDPDNEQTVALPFDAMIHGIVDVDAEGFSNDELKQLKVHEFNEYVATIAANLCSTSLQKNFSTGGTLRTPTDNNESNEDQEDAQKSLEEYKHSKSLPKKVLSKLFERYDEAKALYLSKKEGANENAAALGLTGISVSEKAPGKDEQSSHIVCVREGEKGCPSPGLAENKPFVPKSYGQISAASITLMTTVVPTVSKFKLDLLDCNLYKESIEQAKILRKKMKANKGKKKRKTSTSTCQKKSSSKCGGSKKKGPAQSKCSGSKNSPSPSKCSKSKKDKPPKCGGCGR